MTTTTTTTTAALPTMAAETPPTYAGGPVEVRFPVDASQPAWALPAGDEIEVELVGPGVLTLQVPLHAARAWAGEVFAAVAVAHRAATGDPHALSDAELADLPDPNRYVRTGGTLVEGDDHDPARVRFHIALTVQGRLLATATLAEAIVETLTSRFDTAEVRVDDGTPLAGTATS